METQINYKARFVFTCVFTFLCIGVLSIVCGLSSEDIIFNLKFIFWTSLLPTSLTCYYGLQMVRYGQTNEEIFAVENVQSDYSSDPTVYLMLSSDISGSF